MKPPPGAIIQASRWTAGRDVYDAEVERCSGPEIRLSTEWGHPLSLFSECSPRRWDAATECGCLTQVHSRSQKACTVALTDAIRADSRIPDWPREMEPHHLATFAEWQRRMDREIPDREWPRRG